MGFIVFAKIYTRLGVRVLCPCTPDARKPCSFAPVSHASHDSQVERRFHTHGHSHTSNTLDEIFGTGA